MPRRLHLPMTITWFTVIFVVPMPFVLLLSRGLPTLYEPSARIILVGAIAYCWMLSAIYMSTRPRWLDRLIGLPKIYMVHGILSLLAIILAFAHKSLMNSYGLIALTGNAAFYILAFLGVWSLVFMSGWLSSRFSILGNARRALERIFHHELNVWLHRINVVAVVLIFVHVNLISYIRAITPFMVLFYAASALVAIAYAYEKLYQRFGSYRGEIESVQGIAPNTVEITMKVYGLRGRWENGDFAFIRFPRERKLHEFHPFSIVSVQGRTDIVSFAIRGDGDFTRTLVANAAPGMQSRMIPPYGRYQRFIEEHSANRPIVIFAGGIGVTPLVPVAMSYGSQGRRMRFMYAARSGDQLLYADQIRRWAQTENCDAQLKVGRFSSAEMRHAMEDDALYLVAGPATMLRSIRRMLLAHGVRSDDICYEPFTW
ncbi:ferric reductase [Bifidobacterium sp.]|uniref:ferric reductase n=1 Tax=Bifidobacterium sp. TaxID=41200 RepID=UPI0039E954AD